MEEELSVEELMQIIEKEYRLEPLDAKEGAVLDKDKLTRLIKRVNPKKKRGKAKPSTDNLRDFVSEEEESKHINEFGPYAFSLLDDEERMYFRNRRDEIVGCEDYNLDENLDINIVLMVVMDEIVLHRLFKALGDNTTSKNLNKQISEVQIRYRSNLKALDATREQRNANDRNRENVDSLASVVRMLNEKRNRMAGVIEVYDKEEEELLKRRQLKGSYSEEDYS